MEELPKIGQIYSKIRSINKIDSLEDINKYLENKEYQVYAITLSGISFGEFNNYQFNLIEDLFYIERL